MGQEIVLVRLFASVTKGGVCTRSFLSSCKKRHYIFCIQHRPALETQLLFVIPVNKLICIQILFTWYFLRLAAYITVSVFSLSFHPRTEGAKEQ